jgi:hypothetical protein
MELQLLVFSMEDLAKSCVTLNGIGDINWLKLVCLYPVVVHHGFYGFHRRTHNTSWYTKFSLFIP